jgi:hypothetical protein
MAGLFSFDMYIFIISMIALISPLLLIPIETLLPYPWLIEEIVKLVVVLWIISHGAKRVGGRRYVFLFSLLFSLSETFFYLSSMIASGNLTALPLRLALTTSLHITTMMVLYFFCRKKRVVYLIFGLILACMLHYFFNYFILHLL